MIYVVQLGELPYIKIGYSKNKHDARMSNLQTGAPLRLRLVGTLDGDRGREGSLHAAEEEDEP